MEMENKENLGIVSNHILISHPLPVWWDGGDAGITCSFGSHASSFPLPKANGNKKAPSIGFLTYSLRSETYHIFDRQQAMFLIMKCE
jgi:hypothetical protein